MIRAVLPGMRARHAGTIVNVSSIGARTCPPGSGYYSATKVALEAMTSALRKEIQPLGLTAMVVEPGAFRTDFAGRSLTQSAEAIADYAETAVKRRKENDTVHGTQPVTRHVQLRRWWTWSLLGKRPSSSSSAQTPSTASGPSWTDSAPRSRHGST
jgi:short-subunit dehydrogenase